MVRNVSVYVRCMRRGEQLEVREGQYGGGRVLYQRRERVITPRMVRDLVNGLRYYAQWINYHDDLTMARLLGDDGEVV